VTFDVQYVIMYREIATDRMVVLGPFITKEKAEAIASTLCSKDWQILPMYPYTERGGDK